MGQKVRESRDHIQEKPEKKARENEAREEGAAGFDRSADGERRKQKVEKGVLSDEENHEENRNQGENAQGHEEFEGRWIVGGGDEEWKRDYPDSEKEC